LPERIVEKHKLTNNTFVLSCFLNQQEPKRELPKAWHLVGAMGCDFTKNFPPPLAAGRIKSFLDNAQGEARGQLYAVFCSLVLIGLG
jgi:hypothetical protein